MGFAKDAAIRCMLIVVLPWALRIGFFLHEEISLRQKTRPETYPQYADLRIAFGIFVALLVAQALCRRVLRRVVEAAIPRKQRWSLGTYRLKIVRGCDSIYKCFYYVAMTTWGLFLLRSQSWTPWVLGGSGQTRFCWTDEYPYQTVDWELRRFYLVALAFHMSEAVMLLMERGHPDFWEMLLHHSVSFFLVFYSYMLNYIRIGSLVLVLHGATDIFIYASKVFVDTRWSKLTGISFIGLVLAYLWFRVLVFPYFVMSSAWSESVQEVGASKLLGWGFMNFCMSALLTLHMYWFGLIVKMGLVYRQSGQARDIQANLSSLDVRDKAKAA